MTIGIEGRMMMGVIVRIPLSMMMPAMRIRLFMQPALHIEGLGRGVIETGIEQAGWIDDAIPRAQDRRRGVQAMQARFKR